MDSRNREGRTAASSIGPYKATKLWNEAINAFRQGVPRGKHRRFMRTAEDCFLGSTAVDWMLEYLKKQRDFGSDVTRQQTTQLLNKFFKAGIFEELQLSRRGRSRADFSDSNRLYRLLPMSPSKGTRVPLAVRTINNVRPPPYRGHKDEKHSQQNKEERTSARSEVETDNADADIAIDRLPQCHLVGRFLTGSQINEIWKTAALSRLKKVLGVGSLEDIVQDYAVDGGRVRHNCIFLNKSGIVTNIQQQDQLPHWVLSAMKCLARWPEKVEGDLPSYPGFEKDVFGVVRDYFMGLSEPLFTFDLYDVIINAFVQACNHLPRHSSPFSHAARDEKRFGYSLWSDSSLEDVILNLTRKYCMGDSKTDLFSLAGSRPDLFRSTNVSSECYSRSNLFSGANSQSNLAHSQGSVTADHRHRDVHGMAQSHGDLRRTTRHQTNTLPHSRSHAELFGGDGPCMTSSHGNLHEMGASTGAAHGGRSTSNLHAAHSAQHLPFPSRANSQSTLACFSDLSSIRDSKQFRSNPDLQVSRYETAFGPENQTVTRVYFCSGLATDFHHSSAQEQEELSPVETHFEVNTDGCSSQHQSTHISFDRVNKSSGVYGNRSSNCTGGSESLRSSVGRSRSYNSFQRQQMSGASDWSTFALLSEPAQEPELELKKTSLPLYENERKPPPHRRGRGERHHTLAGSQFVMGRERGREGLDDWDKQLSASTPYLPGLKAGADNHKASLLEGGPRQRTTRSQGLSSGRGSKRASSLYLNFPQSSLHEDRATKALQMVCLFMPPASRRKLHFLLKLMSKMAANPFLTFDPSQSTRSLVLGTFQHAVLRAPEESDLDAVLVFQLVSFLMDHHMDIMAVPTDMKEAVENRLRSLEKPQIVYSPRDPSMVQFTRPMSVQQYESSKARHSHKALVELLDNIARDENMAYREKRRRLKQFQKTYPQIYKERFPDDAVDPIQADRQPRGKPPLLVRPLRKLRSLRV